MFAHRIMNFAGPDGVVWTEAEEPTAEDRVVIDVMAAAVSYADLLQTKGAYQLKLALPFTPGMDAAGVVRSAPPEVGLAVGQRVAVLASYGCWQEVVCAPAEWVLPLPEHMSFEAGAAAPLNYLTGLFALVRRGQARAGETLLVHGAAGGVGTAAVQLGRALGLRTVAVVGDEAKQEFALQCGADHAVLSRGWLGAVRELLRDRGVNIGRPGRRRPDDRQSALVGTGGPPARPRLRRRRDTDRQGEPAPPRQHCRARGCLPRILRTATRNRRRPMGAADRVAADRSAPRSSTPAVPIR